MNWIASHVLELLEEAQVEGLRHIDVRDGGVLGREHFLRRLERVLGERHVARAVTLEVFDQALRVSVLDLRELRELLRGGRRVSPHLLLRLEGRRDDDERRVRVLRDEVSLAHET
ncbi:MAG: hypothetical protein E6J38_13805 [Chloroflexi bacterium]|nr:MAG: hypothetical protein E6J38_13805 [Chloroflexota bacterium]